MPEYSVDAVIGAQPASSSNSGFPSCIGVPLADGGLVKTVRVAMAVIYFKLFQFVLWQQQLSVARRTCARA